MECKRNASLWFEALNAIWYPGKPERLGTVAFFRLKNAI
jgi:hypothetical protein